ncbi:hypothetical protein TrCOL_g511 [Triparma columacea]|uniref:Methyltransferase type 12 domain-containing protein n=1 Tax=Triparma columacea TaxID=722753 RepID=A0A9W7GEX6_9STRA|nr:hypothetical protein TrCOL_g511 [Triparma columacea]
MFATFWRPRLTSRTGRRIYRRKLTTVNKVALDSPAYWQNFYQHKLASRKSSFDWFVDDDEVIRLIAEQVRSLTTPSSKVLHIGCGTSILCEALHSSLDNNTTLLHTDIDETAITQAKKRLRGTLSRWHDFMLDDILSTKLGSGDWNVVVDKGVIDCFVHSGNDEALKTALGNIRSLLSPHGTLVMVTNDDMVTREGDFMRLDLMREWDVPRMKSIELVGEEMGFTCNMFMLRPRGDEN